MFKLLHLLVYLSFLLSLNTSAATYQEPSEFVKETFGGVPPAFKAMWIRKSMQSDIMKIMDRKLNTLRLRYWTKDERFVYILNEVGKEKPITVGLVVDRGKLERVKILIYRESRGWEVRHPFFTDQFKGATMDENYNLDRRIDGISGATLSVRALTKLAKLSLYLYDQCIDDDND